MQHAAKHRTPLQHSATHMAQSPEDTGNNGEKRAGRRDGDERNTLQQHTATHCNAHGSFERRKRQHL